MLIKTKTQKYINAMWLKDFEIVPNMFMSLLSALNSKSTACANTLPTAPVL